MLGAYAAVILLLAASWPKKKWQSLGAKVLAMCGFVCTAAAASLFPVFELPAPTGPYGVGTVTYDLSRKEGDANSRQLVVQLYYPASPASGSQPLPYSSKAATSRFKPQLAMVTTHSYANAPVAQADAAFPLILFSHSWNGIRTEDTFLVESLASNGYVVACIDDLVDTPEVVLADAEVRRHQGLRFLDFSSNEALQASLPSVRNDLMMRVSDIRFVFDELSRMIISDRSNMFYQRVDLTNTGLLGYSHGGSATAQTLRTDARFKAAANLDGYSFAVADGTPIEQPFLTMTGEIPKPQDAAAHDPKRKVGWQFDMLDLQGMEASMRLHDGYLLVVNGAKHPNFSDQPLYSRLRSYTGAGPIAPQRAMEIINAYTVAFFDHYLRQQPAGILAASVSPYPEVTMISTQTLRRASN